MGSVEKPACLGCLCGATAPLWCHGREGGGRERVKEKPHPGKPAARGRRGQGGVKVRGPRPMCFLLPALTGARGSREGRESRKHCSRAGRGCRRAQPFLCCACCWTLPTTPALEESPRGPTRAARPWQPMHSPWLELAARQGDPALCCSGCLARVAGCQWCLRGPSSSRRLSSWLLCWEQVEVAYSCKEMISYKEMIPKGLPPEWSREQGF